MRAILASAPARRILLATALVAPLLVLAIGFGVWRYQHAISEKNVALQVRAERLRAENAATSFWREREAANEYLLNGSTEVYGEVIAERARFDDSVAGLGADVPAEAALVADARRANGVFVEFFQANKGAATQGRAREQRVIEKLYAH